VKLAEKSSRLKQPRITHHIDLLVHDKVVARCLYAPAALSAVNT
jgi:hypothetical protein